MVAWSLRTTWVTLAPLISLPVKSFLKKRCVLYGGSFTFGGSLLLHLGLEGPFGYLVGVENPSLETWPSLTAWCTWEVGDAEAMEVYMP